MRIAWLVNNVFEGWSPTDTRLGGTEESVVRWSEEFIKLGHQVEVYKNGPELEHNGVKYLDRSKYAGADVTFNYKSHDIAPIGRTLYMTNDTDADKQDLSAYECVIWPSQWAKEHIKVNNPNVLVVAHGYDPTHIYPQAKLPKSVLYASSPDRGLDELVSVWPEVIEHHPDAMLIVTYGAPAQDIPNTLFMGNVDEQTMDDLYRTSDVWCHPASGGELWGISGVKAQAAGCVPVYFPTMALRESVQSGVRSSHNSLAGDLIRTLGNDSLKAAIREDLSTKTFPTWETTAKELLALVVK